MADKIRRRSNGYIGENPAPPKKELPKKPIRKIKIEAIKEMAKALNENIKDRSLKAYSPIAKKTEQINKGNIINCQIPSKLIIDLNGMLKIKPIGRDIIPIRKNTRYVHVFSF
ncbi:MAG: hypothetical protein KKG76_14110 [Euryarchaeota archaeon]|nr:hypothetical protein [Euryarchaeota archaeon]